MELPKSSSEELMKGCLLCTLFLRLFTRRTVILNLIHFLVLRGLGINYACFLSLTIEGGIYSKTKIHR